MNCINSSLVKRLANKVDIESLDQIKDKKDKLKSKLYMKKLELLFADSDNLLNRCAHCNQLFTNTQRKWQVCDKAQIFVDAHGQVKATHVADRNFELNKFVISLRAKKVSWKDLFWKLFACVLDFKCIDCNERFTGDKLNHCHYHTKEPFYTYGTNKGSYLCCNTETQRFSTGHPERGC